MCLTDGIRFDAVVLVVTRWLTQHIWFRPINDDCGLAGLNKAGPALLVCMKAEAGFC